MSDSHDKIYKMVLAALLSAIGILIPLISPFKILLEPASFTLASHVAIFIAMFISPSVTAVVCIATTIGFAFAFPPVVVVRAAVQIVFALLGAFWLKKYPDTIKKPFSSICFAFVTGLIHAICETLASTYFYFGGLLNEANYNKGFFISVFLLVGVGTLVHSMVDYAISLLIWAPLSKLPAVGKISSVGAFKSKKSKEVALNNQK